MINSLTRLISRPIAFHSIKTVRSLSESRLFAINFALQEAIAGRLNIIYPRSGLPIEVSPIQYLANVVDSRHHRGEKDPGGKKLNAPYIKKALEALLAGNSIETFHCLKDGRVLNTFEEILGISKTL